jgi:hypothetical protein
MVSLFIGFSPAPANPIKEDSTTNERDQGATRPPPGAGQFQCDLRKLLGGSRVAAGLRFAPCPR